MRVCLIAIDPAQFCFSVFARHVGKMRPMMLGISVHENIKKQVPCVVSDSYRSGQFESLWPEESESTS